MFLRRKYSVELIPLDHRDAMHTERGAATEALWARRGRRDLVGGAGRSRSGAGPSLAGEFGAGEWGGEGAGLLADRGNSVFTRWNEWGRMRALC